MKDIAFNGPGEIVGHACGEETWGAPPLVLDEVLGLEVQTLSPGTDGADPTLA